MKSQGTINILYLLFSLEVGGLENGVINLVNHSRGPRFRHVICCLRRRGVMEGRITRADVPVYCMDTVGDDLWLPFRLARLMRQEKIQLVRCMNADPFLYGFLAAKLARVPVIFYSNGGRSFPEKAHRAWLERLWSRFTDQVTVNSQQLKTDMVSQIGIQAEKICVLDNGVDLSRFSAVPEGEKLALRHTLGLEASTPLIGFVGRLAPQKGVTTLLRAFARIAPLLPACRLLLVGDGPQRQELEAGVQELGLDGRVLFLGSRNDVQRLLSIMDVLALTSIFEGFSNVLLEAMAMSVPVVATDVGDNARIVADGSTGYIVPPQDVVDAISDRLLSLLAQPEQARSMGRAGRRRVEESFSLDGMVRRYEECYLRHLRRKGLVA